MTRFLAGLNQASENYSCARFFAKMPLVFRIDEIVGGNWPTPLNISGMAQELAEGKAVNEACEEPEEQERAQIMKQPEKRTPETLVHPLEIWESEAQVICGDSLRWDDIETGGELYGLYTASGYPAILLARGSGPKTVHEPTHFAHDLDLSRHMMRPQECYGTQWVGTWHSHQSVEIRRLSGRDASQATPPTALINAAIARNPFLHSDSRERPTEHASDRPTPRMASLRSTQVRPGPITAANATKYGLLCVRRRAFPGNRKK